MHLDNKVIEMDAVVHCSTLSIKNKSYFNHFVLIPILFLLLQTVFTFRSYSDYIN